MDEKQLAKLIRKNAARAEKLAKGRSGKNYDNTLPPKPEDDSQDIDRDHFLGNEAPGGLIEAALSRGGFLSSGMSA